MKIFRMSPALLDTEIALKSEYKNDTSNDLILLGSFEYAHRLDFNILRRDFNKIIVFNQEQIDNGVRDFMSNEYKKLIEFADEVWDYDEYNIDKLSTIRNDIKLHNLIPCDELNAGISTKKYDVLFYGSLNEHRKHILDGLIDAGINVVTPFNLWGDNLNPFIASSHICLNIHYYYNTSLQEQARMIRWVSSNANIVSEISRINYMNVHEVNYENIIDECVNILNRLKYKNEYNIK